MPCKKPVKMSSSSPWLEDAKRRVAATPLLIRNSWRADLDRITYALDETTADAVPQPVA